MATTARPQKNRKPEPQTQRRPPNNAWGSPARANGAYSPAPRAPAPAGNGAPAPDRTLQALAGLTGTTVTITTRAGPRFEGVVGGTAPEGDVPGLTLKDARDVNVPGAPIKDRQFIAAANITHWASGPADAKLTPANGDSFKTDVDISAFKAPRRERELQAWADDSAGLNLEPGGANSSPGATIGHGDDVTFGAGASRAGGWDQFAANEKLFGVTAAFDEDVYTTKLDRSAPGFKERELHAQRVANEIMGSTAHNPHVAEERAMNTAADDSGLNEEDKYGAVVRSPGAYVPPAARKNSAGAAVPKLAVQAPDGTPAPAPAPAPASGPAAGAAPAGKAAAPEAAFRDFVSAEKQRLAQKKQEVVRKDMQVRMADLLAFSKNFKLKQPIPDDLMPILAKDADKQNAIRARAEADAAAPAARPLAPGGAPLVASPSAGAALAASPVRLDAATAKAGGVPASASAKAVLAPSKAEKKKPAMFIQAIPAFKSKASGGGGGAAEPASPARAAAPGFRPNPNAAAFSPPAAPPKAKAAEPAPAPAAAPGAVPPPPAPNAFYGTRVIKKAQAVSIRDDFNPFKHHKVAEPHTVGSNWPYTGKRYALLFPPGGAPAPASAPTGPAASPRPPPHQPLVQAPPPQQQQQQPVGPMPGYGEDPNAPQQAPGPAPPFMYYPPPYGYPNPMMSGMPPPGPPGAYMPAPYMYGPPMGGPPMQGPNGQPIYAASPQMGQMQLAPGYMAPPPGAYPPPNGAGPRGPSMPPTPMPAYAAHPGYHPSPQMQHAVPYQMMMPPPGPGPNGPPHGYEGAPAPVQMGGVPPGHG